MLHHLMDLLEMLFKHTHYKMNYKTESMPEKQV
jgi:hypothetical protein